MRKLLILLLLVSLNASAQTASEGAKLHKIFDDEWEWGLREFPERATFVGDRRYDALLTDRSPEAFAKRREHNKDVLARITGIDRAKLSADDQLNCDLALLQAQNRVDSDRFPNEVLQISQMEGVHEAMSDLAQAIPKETVKDYDNFLARLRAYPRAIDQTIALLRRGAKEGLTPPRIILRGVADLIDNQINDDPAKTPIYELAFENIRPSIPEAERTRIQSEARQVLKDEVVPALRRLRAFFIDEYFPKTREAIAWTSVPDGKDWYAFNVRTETTTARTPDEIHQTGLAEVKRIRAAMEEIKTSTGFKGTLAEFFDFLRTDPRFFFTERDALLKEYRDISKRIDPELTKLFGTLPRLPYGVVAVPSYGEKTQTTAYYNSGSPQAHRPGLFYANLYDLKSRPKWEMEALTLHEAVPGHHLQIALAQELTNVPRFRRRGGFTAFVEGWGLYAESLGPELGMYKDPYSKFGQLTYEMWRAVRLVVDTGMHAKGWTRDQAIAFFRDNASKTEHDIEVEIDRYLAWPGQALAYKTGELKIKELRAHAEKELGQKFDIRAFHDQLLGAGPLPLSILETRMKDWVAKERGGAKATITLTR
jgi:uncharacterized protein (DUF885 family)